MVNFINLIKGKLAFLFAITLATIVGGATTAIVMASIPDANGIIHGCIRPNNDNLRVIDTATQNCTGGQTPISWYQNGNSDGLQAVNFVDVNYTLTDTDEIVVADASSGSFDLTLPSAVGREGKIYRLKSAVSSGFNSITVVTQFSQTIDGESSWLFANGTDSVELFSDGSNWLVIN